MSQLSIVYIYCLALVVLSYLHAEMYYLLGIIII